MGDSLAFSPPEPDGVMWRYAAMLADHFDTEVDLRNRAIGSMHSTVMLERLRTDAGLREDLAEADVVTTDIPINVWVDPLQTVGGWQGRDPADCGGDDGQQCLRDALSHYKADTDAIIDEIAAICDPEEVLIRLYDVYMLNPAHDLNTMKITSPYWKAGMDYVEKSAARYGIPVAQVYDAFMGPDGTDDPYLKGLYDEDHLHPNADGAALIAELLDGFGY
ncbi:MAG: SGNH/GDSL hydrolase family protein [Acidimicrobiia bacterium]|nr:SGNH/GDSL hydrolase family protein [Acidimicrobiia bacterium]